MLRVAGATFSVASIIVEVDPPASILLLPVALMILLALVKLPKYFVAVPTSYFSAIA